MLERLHNLAKKEDPSRPTILAGIGFRRKLHQFTDLFGANAYPGWYGISKPQDMAGSIERWNKVRNYGGLCISEYGAGGSVKHHELYPNKIKAWGDWHPEEYQSIVHEGQYREILARPYVWGSFVWNMFDFSADLRNEGDTPGRNDKGLVTFDRKTKKDTYFFYQAQWTEEPMVYITSRRFVDRREATTYIKVFSNCDAVNLRVNGKELGEMEAREMCIYMAENVSLSPGENIIEVVGRKADQTVKDSCKWILNS